MEATCTDANSRVLDSADAEAQERKRKPFWAATHYVYALIDPRTDSVRYIGVSIDPAERLQAHIACSHSEVVNAWIASLAAHSMVPRLVIVGSAVGFHAANKIENRLIYEYRQFHGGLLNRTDPLWMAEVDDIERRVRKWLANMLRDARENAGYWKALCKRRKPRRDTRVLAQEAAQ